VTFPVHVENHEGIWVVRDDKLQGGSKRRALTPLIKHLIHKGYKEFVFGGPAEGYAQLALAHSVNDAKMLEPEAKATYFVAKRKQPHKNTLMAALAGCNIQQVKHGRLNVVQARAKAYCEQTNAYFFPLGFSTPEYEEELSRHVKDAIKGIGHPITETWCVAGSGLLARCLQNALPEATHHAVRIGFEPDVGNAILYTAPEEFSELATYLPPFPSSTNYDAKAWRFIKKWAKPGSLFWNVGA
jgi:hypothetical protein